jgi:hypothetical protein
MIENVSVKKRGRPKKTDLVAKTPGPRSQKVVEAIYGAALDDNHKNQAAAWKLIMDRLLPLSHFEKDKNGGGRAAVSITITGVGGEQTIISSAEDEVIDV